MSDLFLSKHPHRLWYLGRFNQCLFLGKVPLTMEKWVQFGWEGDLMHRFIHRNWGESFVNIFLTFL